MQLCLRQYTIDALQGLNCFDFKNQVSVSSIYIQNSIKFRERLMPCNDESYIFIGMADLSLTSRPLPLLFVATERAMKQSKRARTNRHTNLSWTEFKNNATLSKLSNTAGIPLQRRHALFVLFRNGLYRWLIDTEGSLIYLSARFELLLSLLRWKGWVSSELFGSDEWIGLVTFWRRFSGCISKEFNNET